MALSSSYSRLFWWESISEAVDLSCYGDTTLFESDYDGVTLLALDVQFVEFGWDDYRHDFLTRNGINSDTYDRRGIPVAEESFVDLPCDQVFVVAETITVVEQILYDKWVQVGEGFRFLRDKEFSSENQGSYSHDDAGDEKRIVAGASATGHCDKF